MFRKCRFACGNSYVSLQSIGLKSEKYVSGFLGWHTAEGNKQDGDDPVNFVTRDDDAAYKRRMFVHQVQRVSHCCQAVEGNARHSVSEAPRLLHAGERDGIPAALLPAAIAA